MEKKDWIDELFDAYPILNNIGTKDELKNLFIVKAIQAGENINSYGESCIGFLFILNGELKIRKVGIDGEETFLYDIQKGNLCHEAISCHMKNQSINVIATAVQDSKIAILPFEYVTKLLFTNNEFLKYVYKDLYNKFIRITTFKEESIHDDIEKRIVKWLLSKNTKNIYITHSEIAFEIGTAREVISRKLKSMEKEGLISLQRGKIILNNKIFSYLN